MIRKIIEIDKEKCNGCGICAQACHEGAIGIVNGKAELLRDDYCDGLGDLLIAADCTAYAYGNFHTEFIKNRITIIGCPKLDNIDYTDKLTEIIKQNDIKSVTIVRMEVPCCGGIENAVKTALQQSGKFIPWQVFTITTDGNIKE